MFQSSIHLFKFVPSLKLLLALLFMSSVALSASSGDPEYQEVAREVTPVMCEVLVQSAKQGSETPILALLATVPVNERMTLALSLFLQTTVDYRPREHLTTILFHMANYEARLNSTHSVLLTQAYLHRSYALKR